MRAIASLFFLVAATAFAQDEPVVSPIPAKDMKPGYGVVASVTDVQVLTPERSAAAGGSARGERTFQPMYRIGIRMPDGAMQYRDLDKPEFKVGDNVLLTNAGDILPD
ncbi:MAG TPA: hypothetical protein VEU32_12585 [Burkholderiales bacterium]|nr:hypothetical protein [Burkholderiales bacterium]